MSTPTEKATKKAIAAGLEVCLCAAHRFQGRIWRGNRHNHSSEAMRDELSNVMNRRQMNEQEVNKDSGFLTSFNRYVDRQEGFKLQKAAGIPSAATLVGDDYRNGTLFSEDLY